MAKKGKKGQKPEAPVMAVESAPYTNPPAALPLDVVVVTDTDSTPTPDPEPARTVVNIVTLTAAVRCSLGELKAGTRVVESDFQPGEMASLRAQGAVE